LNGATYVLLDILGDVLSELVPTPRRVERWVLQHPTAFSVDLGVFTFAGFTLSAWTDGGTIPWVLTSGLGVAFGVVMRVGLAFRAYGEKRRMATGQAEHGPDRRGGPEKPLPRLFEAPSTTPTNSCGTGPNLRDRR
jgi:hypothetical protein